MIANRDKELETDPDLELGTVSRLSQRVQWTNPDPELGVVSRLLEGLGLFCNHGTVSR